MCDRLDDFGPNVEVVLITFTDQQRALDYANQRSTPIAVLIDVDRSIYRAYGLDRGPLRRMYGLRTLRRYVHILRRDGMGALQRPTEDTQQLGGNFVIDTDATLLYGFWGAAPYDRPSIDGLVAAATVANP